MSEPDDQPFGTTSLDAPVSRRDFERAVRHLNVSDLELRDAVLQLVARVVTLTDELTRRVDGVEPDPAPPGTPAPSPTQTVEDAVQTLLPAVYANVRAMDTEDRAHVSIDLGGDKYTTENSTPPCAEVLHLCGARCCTFNFALSTADLDEGVIRWDYGQPYLIRQRASDGYCVHNDPASHHCTVHEQRPRVCRSYDCRDDRRIWVDFEQRIPATVAESKIVPEGEGFDLMERARLRHDAVRTERASVGNGFADLGPTRGPRR